MLVDLMLESYIFRQIAAKLLPKTESSMLWRISFRMVSFAKDCLQPSLSLWPFPSCPTITSATIAVCDVGEGGVQSTIFCIFNHCYYISSPNKLKICHTLKQLYIHNIMPKHQNNTLQKKF